MRLYRKRKMFAAILVSSVKIDRRAKHDLFKLFYVCSLHFPQLVCVRVCVCVCVY